MRRAAAEVLMPPRGQEGTGSIRAEHVGVMATYLVNLAAVAKCRALVDARQYVLDSLWGEVQPDAGAWNRHLESHHWDDYAALCAGLTEGVGDHTEARYPQTAHACCSLDRVSG